MVQRGRHGQGNRHSAVQPPGHRTGELFKCHGGIGISRRLPGREITALGGQPEPALRSVYTRLQEPDYFRQSGTEGYGFRTVVRQPAPHAGGGTAADTGESGRRCSGRIRGALHGAR